VADEADRWPSEIRLTRDRKTLRLAFESGPPVELAAEYLRVKSPSAEVRGHGPGEGITVSGKRNVLIASIEAVGNYAIRIMFDDGHSTGIYSWSYLVELARDEPRIWNDYLEALEARGLGRDA
jgi:DUF971 family protein